MEGLNEWAGKLVQSELVPMKVSGYYEASDGVKYPLYGYELPDGRKLSERVLFEKPRPKGRPALFLVLQDETGGVIPESVWNKEEVMNGIH